MSICSRMAPLPLPSWQWIQTQIAGSDTIRTKYQNARRDGPRHGSSMRRRTSGWIGLTRGNRRRKMVSDHWKTSASALLGFIVGRKHPKTDATQILDRAKINSILPLAEIQVNESLIDLMLTSEQSQVTSRSPNRPRIWKFNESSNEFLRLIK